MQLNELVADLQIVQRIGNANPEVTKIVYDSRQAESGSLFVAIPGFKIDGTRFVRDAVTMGAVAIVGEAELETSVPYLRVPNARKALAQLAWSLAGHPEQKLRLIAVTGTNGKTTITTVLSHVLNHSGIPCGSCGTLGLRYGNYADDSLRTTPEASDLAPHLSRMVREQIACCVMETTSIGIELERVYRLPFEIAVFSNLTRDHLDFHGSWNAYRDAKLRLFRELDDSSISVINIDDPAGRVFCEQSSAPAVTYGEHPDADFRAVNIKLAAGGIEFDLLYDSKSIRINSSIIGRFNALNLCAVFAAAVRMGITDSVIAAALGSLPNVRGRAEVVPSVAPFTIVVDYAHTPDALSKILESLRELKPHRILTIVGAGGDRDRGKRPEMTRAVEAYSDSVYLTSDNPRTEDPETILQDMAAGIANRTKFTMNPDRRQTIESALRAAAKGDVVLIAGKGHESYQEIQGTRHPFDDRQVALDWLKKAGFAK